jgi:hypothetical protein
MGAVLHTENERKTKLIRGLAADDPALVHLLPKAG